jgi:DNA invertase Pin-like site-specific DNA recombinase
MLTVLGELAAFAKDLLRVRTAEGHARARARDVRTGRKLTLTPHRMKKAIKRRDAGEPMRDIGKRFNVSHSTIFRLGP